MCGEALAAQEAGLQGRHLGSDEGVDAVEDRRQVGKLQFLTGEEESQHNQNSRLYVLNLI